MKIPTETSHIIKEKTKITNEQMKTLFKNYSPVNDDSPVSSVQLGFPNQAEYRGEWNEKLKERHGRGIQIWVDNTMYLGQWRHDKAEGKGKIIHPNGEYYEGDFVNDQAEGYGKYMHKDGNYYEGQWKKDLQDGKGTETWPNKVRYKGEFRDGKKNGRGKINDQMGAAMKVLF